MAIATFAMLLLMPITVWTAVAALPTTAGQQPEGSPVADQATMAPIGTPGSTTEPAARCSDVLGTGGDGDACVAFVHAVPALDSVNLTFDGDDGGSATNVAFGDFVDFVAVPATDVTVLINDTASPDLLITESSLSLQPGVAYTLVLEQAYNQDAPIVTAVPIDLAPLEPEASRIMFHHSVSDADELSVLGLALPSDTVIAPGETTDSVTVDAGASSISVVPGNEQGQILATLDVQFEPGLSYLIIIGGTTGDQTLSVIYAAAPVLNNR